MAFEVQHEIANSKEKLIKIDLKKMLAYDDFNWSYHGTMG